MSAELEALIAEARKQWLALPRHEQLRLEREMKIDWVLGEMKLRGHSITRERIEELLAEQEARARAGLEP